MTINDALTAYQRGDLQSAESLCVKVLREQPKNNLVWELRGLVAWRAGQLEQAINFLKAALEIDSINSSHLFNLAQIQISAGQNAAAEQSLETILKDNPSDAEALASLGIARMHLGNIKSAISLQQQALTINPENPLFHNNLGLALVRNRELADAVSEFRKANTLWPNQLEILRNLATYSEMSGDTDSALQAVLIGIKHRPEDPALNVVQAKLALREKDAEKAIRITDQFQLQNGDVWLASDFAFIKATALEMQSNFSEAFKTFEAANNLAVRRLQRSGFRQSELLNRQTISTLIEYYETQNIQTDDIEISDNFMDPIFVVGMPRSGTTLLDSVLGSALNANVLEEEGTVYQLLIELKNNNIDYPGDLSQIDKKIVGQLRNVYFGAAAEIVSLDENHPLIDKLPFNLLHIGLLLKVFPCAKIIRALRHPADVVISNFKQNYEEAHSAMLFADIPSALEISEEFQQLWSLQTKYHESRVTTVKYEDLVADKINTAENLFQFLGHNDVKFDESARQDFAKKKLNRITPNYSAITKEIRGHGTANWKNYSEELTPFSDRLSMLANTQGYGDETA